jgi:hypothetical protein
MESGLFPTRPTTNAIEVRVGFPLVVGYGVWEKVARPALSLGNMTRGNGRASP